MTSGPARNASYTRAARPPADPGGPTGLEIFDELLVLVTMPVLGLTLCPGFLLCVPGLLLVVVPVVALGVLAAVAVGVIVAAVAAPLLAARAMVRHIGRAHVT